MNACTFGRHRWTEFGDCERCGKPRDLSLLAMALFGDRPYERVADRRHAASVLGGLELQQQMARLGQDVSLELCRDFADRGEQDALLSVARERYEPTEANRIADSRPPDRVTADPWFEDDPDHKGIRRRARIESWRLPDGRLVARKSWEYAR